VRSGQDAAAGDTALALMRADASGYRLVRHLYVGSGVTAKLRVATRAARDVLIAVQRKRRQGLYRDVCGFLGQGSFREHAGEGRRRPGDDDELALVSVGRVRARRVRRARESRRSRPTPPKWA